MKGKGEQGFTSLIQTTDGTVPNGMLRWVLKSANNEQIQLALSVSMGYL